MADLKRLVAEYRRENLPALRAMLRSYRKVMPLSAAILHALGIHPAGGKHPHQYRLNKGALRKAGARLLKRQTALRACSSFEEILAIVEGEVAKVRGLGDLAAYDAALRIGAALRRAPPKQVRLHAGTKKGCMALLSTTATRGKRSLPASAFPTEIAKLKPHEIEDFMCIFKDRFQNAESVRSECPARRRRGP